MYSCMCIVIIESCCNGDNGEEEALRRKRGICGCVCLLSVYRLMQLCISCICKLELYVTLCWLVRCVFRVFEI